MQRPRCWSGAHRIFSPRARRYATISSPTDEVTTQSARALAAAQVFAYTTAVRSGCASRQAPTASGGRIAPETRHLQRIRDASAGLRRQFLQFSRHIIGRNEHGPFAFEQRADALNKRALPLR